MKNLLIILLVLVYSAVPAQEKGTHKAVKPSVPADFCIGSDALILYNMINDFRRTNKLPVIPLSRSMCYVALMHISDLRAGNALDNGCGLHSWSDKGNWRPCCYTKDPARSECMSNKPKELTGYPGTGYEVVYWGEETATPLAAIETWRSTGLTKNVFLNIDKWKTKQWKAIGVAIEGGFAIVWLGDKTDTPGNLALCGTDSLVLSAVMPVTKAAEDKTVPQPQKPAKAEDDSDKPKIAEKAAATSAQQQNTELIPGKERFYLVVASLREEAAASEQARKLQDNGYKDAMVVKGDNVFRVIVGEFSNREDAQKRLNKLAADFKGIWILRQ